MDFIAMTILSSCIYMHFLDIEAPVIGGCPSDQSGNTDSGLATGTISWTAPTATDNSGTQTLTSTHNPGDSFPIGTTTVTYTATDAAGNSANCSFDVIVNGKSHCLVWSIYRWFLVSCSSCH